MRIREIHFKVLFTIAFWAVIFFMAFNLLYRSEVKIALDDLRRPNVVITQISSSSPHIDIMKIDYNNIYVNPIDNGKEDISQRSYFITYNEIIYCYYKQYYKLYEPYYYWTKTLIYNEEIPLNFRLLKEEYFDEKDTDGYYSVKPDKLINLIYFMPIGNRNPGLYLNISFKMKISDNQVSEIIFEQMYKRTIESNPITTTYTLTFSDRGKAVVVLPNNNFTPKPYPSPPINLR